MISTFARTDVGRVRDHNEDSVLCTSLEAGRYLLVVADGIGGTAGGEVASAAIVAELDAYVRHRSGADDDETLLRGGLEAASAEFAGFAAGNPGVADAGTTLVAALLDGPRGAATVLNVGDSRAYVYDPESGLQQVTTDHTVGRERAERGETQSGYAHVLSRWVGVERAVAPDVTEVSCESGAILLCSDGLWNELSDESISSIFERAADVDEAGDGLVRAALEHGGRDNVSVVLAAFE